MATLKKKPSRLSTFFSSSSFSSSTDLSLPPQEQPPPQPQAQLHPDVPRGRFRQDSLPPPPSVNLHPTFVPDQFAAHHRVASGPAYYTPPAPENAPPPPPAHGDLPPPYQPGQQPSPQPDNPHKSPSILRKPVATSSEQVRSRSPLRKSASHANLAVPGLQPIALRDGAKSQPGSRPSTPDEKAREKKLTRKSWFGGGGGQESSRSKAQQAWVVTGRETGGRGEGSEGQPKPVEEYPLGRLFGGNMVSLKSAKQISWAIGEQT
ncbi:hypothetical protein P152DRAFT_55909 [Eremomyces bilateralis CBS 781.70]|uniref:Uncharacterized protein n=1 Tax=Eremomyces bilateralis CBS 781.70 TaxID=1392243 RepID=A0A6G1G090_9PEZI|nr:uncharacterized protein P152DRAFT_55909 [Eremomyces bilateralis CBS 781.70]KAF1811438.1 hypothetical protein P152DRAFT_55909 [Eremomyces bilateralis CBS 781.70]